MKKVLFMVNHDVVIYNFRLELVERLLKEEYEVMVSSPSGERIQKLVDMGVRHFSIDMNRHGINLIEEIKLFFYYVRLVKREKPDVVLTYTIKPNIYGGMAAEYMKIPYIANITGLGSALEKKGILQIITVLLYKIAFIKIQCVFLQNQENLDFFKKKRIAIGKHKLLPGSGVNLEYFSLLPYPTGDTIEFAFISRIMKEKGIHEYLKAAVEMRKRYPQTRFHVCGFCEEEYEEDLRRYEKENIIIYHGMINDVRKILKKIHCLIHPSYYPEGISNVCLESAACGRPVITTERSGCRETVSDNISGYIVPIQNTDKLVKRVQDFINLPWEKKKQMGVSGRKKVEKEFNRQRVIECYMKEIEVIGAADAYDK